MKEITKLRSRLRNAGRNTVEYRMTVVEARALLDEIDAIIKQKQEILVVKEQVPVAAPVQPGARIFDGGSFT